MTNPDQLNPDQVAAIKSAPEGAQLKIQGQLYKKQGQQLVPAEQPVDDTPPATRSWRMEALPIGGAILGGMGGGPIGAGLGAGIGEEAAQVTEMLQGKREAPDVGAIFRTGAEQGAMEGLAAPVAKLVEAPLRAVGGALGRTFQRAAPKAIEELLPRSKYESKLVQAYRSDNPIFWDRIKSAVTGKGAARPRTVGQTVIERGVAGNTLYGTETGIGVQAKRAQKALWNKVIDPALKSSPTKVNMQTFLDTVESRIIKDTPELSRQKELLEAVTALKEDYKDVGDVSLSKLQQFKEGWAKFVPAKVYLGKDIKAAFTTVQNEAAGLARETIHNELGPGVRQAYLDYGNLIEVAEHGQTAMTGAARAGGAGRFMSSIKNAIVTPIASMGGQVVYRVGQTMETAAMKGPPSRFMTLVGPPGARVVRDILTGMPEVGRPTNGGSRAEAQPLPSPEAAPTPPPVSPDALQLMREKPLGHVLDRWRQSSEAEKAQFRPILLARLMRGNLMPADRDQLRAALMPNSLPEEAPVH